MEVSFVERKKKQYPPLNCFGQPKADLSSKTNPFGPHGLERKYKQGLTHLELCELLIYMWDFLREVQ